MLQVETFSLPIKIEHTTSKVCIQISPQEKHKSLVVSGYKNPSNFTLPPFPTHQHFHLTTTGKRNCRVKQLEGTKPI